MSKPLLKTAHAHFAMRTTAFADSDVDAREARRIAKSSLRKALRERGVKAKLVDIYHKPLVDVWQGAQSRLPAFVSRLNELTNRHLQPDQQIQLKTPPLSPTNTVREYEDAIFEAIISKLN